MDISDSQNTESCPRPTIGEIFGRPNIIGHRPSRASLSPDGTEIAYVWAQAESPQLWVVPSSGGEPRQLTSLDEGVSGAPQWSKDGAALLIQSSGDLYLVTTDAGLLQRRTQMSALSPNYRWTSDGAHIVFTAGGDLWMIAVDGRGPTQLTMERGVSTFECAPVGNEVAFTGRLAERRLGLFVVDVDTTEVAQVNLGVAESITWVWSPDGNRLAFT